MDEKEFTDWIASALGAMHGLAISITIIGHTAHLRNGTLTYRRLIGANARDVVSIIDSLARDQYRNGGVYGLSSYTIGQIKKRSGCWVDRTFNPILDDLLAARARKPVAVMDTIEQMRREATAHFPIFGQTRLKPPAINAEDMWQAYGWLKEMLLVWLSRLNPPYPWPDERTISTDVLRDLSSPILAPVQTP